jgi:flagellin
MRTRALGLKGDDDSIVSISTKEDANATINVLDNVLTKVLDQQSMIGSAISRLERTATNLQTAYTDDQASESVIRDADMATEMAGYLKYNVLSQASQAMLAQANQSPENALALLGEQSSK